MPISEVALAITLFTGFVLFDILGSFYSTWYLLVYFLIAFALQEGGKIPTFYAIMLLGILIFALFKYIKLEEEVADVNLEGNMFSNYKGYLISAIIGVGIYLAMTFLQSGREGAIIGVPALAIGANLSLASVVLLAPVENRFFIGLFELLKVVYQKISMLPIFIFLAPMTALVLPLVSSALLFSIFHLAAYDLRIVNLIFAFSVMLIWFVSYIALKNTIAMDFAHSLWNFSVRAGKLVAVGA